MATAVTTELPAATPTTGTLTVLCVAGTVTLTGTVAAAVLPEVRFTSNPPTGAGVESVKVRFCVAVPTIECGEGVSVIVAPPPPLPARIVSDSVTLWLVPVLSVKRKVKEVLDTAVAGVPEIRPVALFSVRPAGSVPAVKLQVRGAVPPPPERVCE